MAISCFIVDDSIAGRDRISTLLNSFFAEDTTIIGESSSSSSAFKEILTKAPDLAFLDVEMPKMTGLELAEKLYDHGYKGKRVFVTGHLQYSVKAIRANAFDYLVKPVDVDELKQCLERLKLSFGGDFNKKMISSFDLSEREEELIPHLSKGLSSTEIAKEMKLSRHTVDTHRRNIHTKTGTRNVVELLNLLRS